MKKDSKKKKKSSTSKAKSSSKKSKKTSKKKPAEDTTKKKKKKSSKGTKENSSDSDYIGFGEPPPKKKKFKDPWYKRIPWLELPPNGSEKEVRPVLGLFEMYQHYVKFTPQDGGKLKGFYVNCPDYVREEKRLRTGSKRTCPICKNFIGRHLPDHLNFYGGYSYLFDAFDLTALKEDDGSRLFGTVRCTTTNRREIVRAERRNGANVADPDDGCTLFWEFDSDADNKANSFSRGKKRTVSYLPKTKKFIVKVKSGGKTFKAKGKPTDFKAIIDIPTPEEITETLERLGCWDSLAKEMKKDNKESSKSKGKKKSKKKKKKSNRWNDE